MKKLKKFVAAILCFTMLFSLTSNTLAVTLSPESKTNKVLNEIVVFMGSAEKEGHLSYSLPQAKSYNNIEGTIDKKILEDGNVQITVTEGSKTDHLLVTQKGAIYLDGNIVRIIDNQETISDTSSIVPYAHSQKLTDKVPDGTTASDYNKLIGSKEKVIWFEKAFELMTISTFMFVLTAALPWMAFLTAGVETYDKVFTKVQDTSPRGQSLSVRYSEYQHKNGPVVNKATVTKRVEYWYTKEDFTGYLTSTTVYHILSW